MRGLKLMYRVVGGFGVILCGPVCKWGATLAMDNTVLVFMTRSGSKSQIPSAFWHNQIVTVSCFILLILYLFAISNASFPWFSTPAPHVTLTQLTSNVLNATLIAFSNIITCPYKHKFSSFSPTLIYLFWMSSLYNHNKGAPIYVAVFETLVSDLCN